MTNDTGPASAQELLDLIARLAAKRWYQQQLNGPQGPAAAQASQNNSYENGTLVRNRRTAGSRKRGSRSDASLKE